MRTMKDYSLFCTEPQTRKALELGAPIDVTMLDIPNVCEYEGCSLKLPTAEQMIGWLEEKIYNIIVIKNKNGTWFYMIYWENSLNHEIKGDYTSRKEATIAAIDAALEYLTNNKK